MNEETLRAWDAVGIGLRIQSLDHVGIFDINSKTGRPEARFNNFCCVLKHSLVYRLDIRFNVTRNTEEVWVCGKYDSDIDDDYVEAVAKKLSEIFLKKVSCGNARESIVHIAHEYNPVSDYLTELAWDGVDRFPMIWRKMFSGGAQNSTTIGIMANLSNSTKTMTEADYAFRRMCISFVSSGLNRRPYMTKTFVLVGDSESFVRSLFSDAMTQKLIDVDYPNDYGDEYNENNGDDDEIESKLYSLSLGVWAGEVDCFDEFYDEDIIRSGDLVERFIRSRINDDSSQIIGTCSKDFHIDSEDMYYIDMVRAIGSINTEWIRENRDQIWAQAYREYGNTGLPDENNIKEWRLK